MDVEPSVIKRELTDLLKVTNHAKSTHTVATRLDDIGFDHFPTTQYRAGDQIKTELLTRVSDLIATAKQGENADAYIKEAREVLTVALGVKSNDVYSTKLLHGNYHLPPFSLADLKQSIKKDLKAFN